MLNRSVLPITSTLVVPAVNRRTSGCTGIETWRDQGLPHKRPLIQLPSIEDSGKVHYEIQAHLNYWYTLK